MELDFASLWKTIENGSIKDQKRFWDLRAAEFNSQLASERTVEEAEDVLKYLKDKGAVDRNHTILDIGCGTGKYALAFAREAKNVTCIDISAKMIAFAKENAQSRGCRNIELVQASWSEVELEKRGWKKKFNLVFAAFCPGIDSPEALKKMIEASRKHCFLSGFVTRQDRVMDGLEAHLGIRENIWGNQIYFCFNLLWQWGYYPEITYKDRSWTKEYDVEHMADILNARLNGKASREDIIKYLNQISVNGKVTEVTTSKVARLYWKV